MDPLDELYGVRPDEFVTVRDRLAKELRAAGDKERAAEVKALRRPTPSAWAVNQLARAHPHELKEAVDAGDRLRLAQRRAASGAEAKGYREATSERDRAVQKLVRRAEGILKEAGLPSGRPQLDAVADTLNATATDLAGRDVVLSGRLHRELDPTGFGDLSGLTLVPGETTPVPAPPARSETPKAAAGPVAPTQRERDKAAEEREQQERAEAEQARERAQLVAVRDNAKARLEEVQAEARRAKSEAERAEQEAREAERRAAEARDESDKLRARADDAGRALSEADGVLRGAEERLDAMRPE